ncbi:RNA 2',3'-cyclic phosphodiesterase [Halopseudomonas salegens]|uniref:RNA 2',3'-cyclic phosphodiesterase n=1 Tax=Halopseudomonas salegens TaxID=1434072 RepID=A0A1H2H438_9GAMM|nr:RNA 2',3'-cyclic phosphodiesterase [Halopseudomonas salegens]SDU26318.1 2'-5' RNA ligase [Halopseudomonas salegens]
MENSGKRLFIGLELPGSLQRLLARLTTDLPGARWHLPQDLHITVRFLGQLDPVRQQDIHQLLKQSAITPFSLQVSGIGHFDQRILWAGLAPSPSLQAMKQQLDQSLQALNLPAEMHDYHPHITLARIRAGHQSSLNDFVEAHHELALPAWGVTHVSLFESRNNGQGRYHVLGRYPLRQPHHA